MQAERLQLTHAHLNSLWRPGSAGLSPSALGTGQHRPSCQSCPSSLWLAFSVTLPLGIDNDSLCNQLISGPTTLHNRRCGEGWRLGGPESGPVFSFLCSGRICFSATFPSKHSPAGRCLLHRFLNDEMIWVWRLGHNETKNSKMKKQ